MRYIRQEGELLLPQLELPAADKELMISLYEAHGSDKEPYQELSIPAGRKEDIKAAWHLGEDADLTVDSADKDRLLERVDSLKRWKDELLESNTDPDIKQIYRWKVNEMIGNTYMVIASAEGNMRDFRRWNEFVYGKPDEDIYRGALDWVAHDAEDLLAVPDQHPAVAEAASRVLDRLEGERGYRELLSPEPETFEAVRNDHMSQTGFYGLLLAGIDMPKGKVPIDIRDKMLKRVIHNIGSDKPIIDSRDATWGVTSEGVKRPPKSVMVSERLQGLGFGHEVGSHELERVNGSRGPVYLAKEGLDRYELGNEGRAVIREQVVYGTFDEFGKIVRWRDILRRHIAISYAWGVGQDSPRSDVETHQFMSDIDFMYQAKLRPDDLDEAKTRAVAKTDALLLRVLKGGGAYLKDKVYLEGNVASWLTAATHGPGAISDGDLGKFDINNLRHIKVLQNRGLLPDRQ